VTAGLAVIGGTEDRQHAYVALTRGTSINLAYVFTVSAQRADPAPGPPRRPSWTATTRYIRNEQASPSRPPHPLRPVRRWPCWPPSWTETASSCPRPRTGTAP
jgi:hypothetical protein